jgi:hypothetical protein
MQTTKSTVFWAFLFLSIFVFISILVNRWQTTTPAEFTIADENECVVQNNRCDFTIAKQKFELSFNQVPIPEEEISIQLASDQPFEFSKGWIEGVNMYMGKSPFIVESVSPNRIEGIMFLGSCNLNEMQWHLFLELKEKPHPVRVRFSTHIN